MNVLEVEDTNMFTQKPVPWVRIGVAIGLIITGVILGFVVRTKSNR